MVFVQDVGSRVLKILILRVTSSERIRKQIVAIETTDHREREREKELIFYSCGSVHRKSILRE